MTTTIPINARATVNAVHIPDPDEFNMGGSITAGHFGYYTQSGREGSAGILFGCPCGCGELMSGGFDTHESSSPRWHWDGNVESPTLTPSINILQHNIKAEQVGEHWHGWLRDGVFVSV